jgi:hypothetical protein
MSSILQNIASKETTNLKSHIACLDVLKWTVLNSVQGFQETEDFSLTQEKRNKLMERGLQNVKDNFPNAANFELRIKEKLTEAIDKLWDGALELDQHVAQSLQNAVDDMVGDGHDEPKNRLMKAFVPATKQLIKNKTRDVGAVKAKLLSTGRALLLDMGVSESVIDQQLGGIASILADGNTDKRKAGERYLSFLWTNLLLPKSKQYAVSPLSGFTPGSVGLPIEPLLCYLRYKNKQGYDIQTILLS